MIVAVAFQWSDGGVSAQSADPLTLPRLAFTNFTYLGGFRLPRDARGDDFSYGGSHMAYNPARNSLFVNSLRHKVAEIAIPTPANTNDVNQMPFASYLQPFSDPSEGHLQEMSPNGGGVVMGGLLVHGDRLYTSGYIYYDGANAQRVSHFSHSTNLSEPSFVGMSQVWDTARAGFVGGYMANIPAEWQSVLGGPAFTGQCCIPIITRTSYGPSAFAWDPARMGNNTAVPATPLLYYPHDHTTLGIWEGSNEVFGGATMMGGAAVIAGTRTALFVGRNGLGKYCYGHGVSDPLLDGTKAADGVTNCYDPTVGAKGPHTYPYRYQMWAYDLADFAAVKAGAKQPWDVIPYAVWPFDFPTPEPTIQIGGVAYDAQRQLLYVAQYLADQNGCCERPPIIHTLKINIGSSTPPPPVSTSVSLTPSVAAPQPPGTLIQWSAAATGGQAPYEYKWASYANGAWSVLRDWSASQTFDWQPTVGAEDARMAVWVRTAPSAPPSGELTADAIAATAEYPFAIVDAPADPATAPVASVAVTTNLPAPQPASTTITWTATPTGGSGALVYKWFVTNDGGTWNAVGTWTSSNQFTWTPTVANPNYSVSVWVKHATNPADAAEASTYRPFPITEPAFAPVASVALATNLPAPQPASSSILWTATPTGGSTGALVYKWFITNDGGTWNAVGTWTSSNQFAWTPTVANPNYSVSVWVKHATNSADAAEASTYRLFPITDRAVSSVTLTSSLASPQVVSSTIVWTATQAGGTGAIEYKWWVSNDGGGSWTPAGTWTASNQFAWTPAAAGSNYRVAVWAKRASTSPDSFEATADAGFAVTDRPVSNVTLTSNLASPQLVSSTIVWTATQAGGTGAIVYKWLVSNDGGVSWSATGPWAVSNQFAWTPTAAGSNYRVAVWAKRASNPTDAAEAAAEAGFAITVPDGSVSAVTLTSHLASPQPLWTSIVWTATPIGGTGSLVYRWFISEDGGASWTATGPWRLSNKLTWTPKAANPNYRVRVWVKRSTNSSASPEASAEAAFAITPN